MEPPSVTHNVTLDTILIVMFHMCVQLVIQQPVKHVQLVDVQYVKMVKLQTHRLIQDVQLVMTQQIVKLVPMVLLVQSVMTDSESLQMILV
jgi:hypothetical protein